MIDILIVEDNVEIAGLICDFLRAENYIVSIAETGEKALSLFEKYGARLVLLDIMLPEDDKLNGLTIGADDYMEKPFDIDILIAKIKGIFRRRYSQELITLGELEIDPAGQTALLRGRPLDLTGKEFQLLLMLAENIGKVLTKEQLFNSIWGTDSESEPQTLTVHIKRLREKIERDPSKPEHIKTVWGTGYKFI